MNFAGQVPLSFCPFFFVLFLCPFPLSLVLCLLSFVSFSMMSMFQNAERLMQKFSAFRQSQIQIPLQFRIYVVFLGPCAGQKDRASTNEARAFSEALGKQQRLNAVLNAHPLLDQALAFRVNALG